MPTLMSEPDPGRFPKPDQEPDAAAKQATLEQRDFANGKRRVTRLGLGMAALGRPGYINLGHGDDYRAGRNVESMRRRAFQVLDSAWAGGVRYFDAARSYGKGEEFLGQWLREREIAPHQVTVASKWGYTYTAGWQVQAATHEIKDHSPAVLTRQWRETHGNLGEWLGLYQIHSATFDSGVLEQTEVHRALAHIKEQGILIGLTLSGPSQAQVLERALDIVFDGMPLFDTVQATWNLLEPSAGPALAFAHAEGIGIIVKEALANGRLTNRNTDPELQRRAAELLKLADTHQCTPDAVALAAALAQPWADVVLSGAATVEQLNSNLSALRLPKSLPSARLQDQLREPPDAYWATRAELSWN